MLRRLAWVELYKDAGDVYDDTSLRPWWRAMPSAQQILEMVNAMSETAVDSATIYFSYSQFLVFDRSVRLAGCAWTEAHTLQGFARRKHNVSFATLLEFGLGDVSIYLGPYVRSLDHQRVIEVPIENTSGEFVVEGPEDMPGEEFPTKCPVGHYRLVAAQRVTEEDREEIDLYFEKLDMPVVHSRILIADDGLRPSFPLLEDVEVA